MSLTELKNSGLKATLARLKILELFKTTSKKHLHAEEVHQLLNNNGDLDVSLATVYRVLLQFEQAGLLTKQHFDENRAFFELSEHEHHDHLVCLDCGHVQEFCDDLIEQQQNTIATQYGFKLQSHELLLYGHCMKQECQYKTLSKS